VPLPRGVERPTLSDMLYLSTIARIFLVRTAGRSGWGCDDYRGSGFASVGIVKLDV